MDITESITFLIMPWDVMALRGEWDYLNSEIMTLTSNWTMKCQRNHVGCALSNEGYDEVKSKRAKLSNQRSRQLFSLSLPELPEMAR